AVAGRREGEVRGGAVREGDRTERPVQGLPDEECLDLLGAQRLAVDGEVVDVAAPSDVVVGRAPDVGEQLGTEGRDVPGDPVLTDRLAVDVHAQGARRPVDDGGVQGRPGRCPDPGGRRTGAARADL